MAEENQLEIDAPAGIKFKGNSSQFLLLMALLLPIGIAGAAGYLLQEHEKNSQIRDAAHIETDRQVAKAIDNTSKSLDNMSKTINLQNCILSKEQKQRETEFTNPNSTCRVITGTNR